ncbi:TIGR02186 family protein [Maritimibacter sp. DP1N21-5]|uniref:TIGR02186 family protein n=1 Tax=Maritimibacter sp. DP1N21-5 TaxID=2836867 RepID=UPI00351CDC74
MRIFALLLILLTGAAQAQTEEDIVAGLSQNRVAIDATFVGSEILVFGAVKREAPAPEGALGVVIVVQGPNEPVTVRRKDRKFGIWVNAESVDVQEAPSFYAVATSGPFDEVLSVEDNRARLVSIDESVWVMDTDATDNEKAFADALIRIREDEDLYSRHESTVRVSQETLFDAAIQLPANVTEGLYQARIFLTREGRIIADQVSYVSVQKVGLERWVYNLAHDVPLVYGLLSLAIAIAAGWLASAAFRVFLRN